jgi:putative ABC transport system substrate-binding protein
MRRRDFFALLGGAAVALPLKVRAQQAPKLPSIGFMSPGSPSSPQGKQWIAAFMQRLRELGWIEGRTVNVELRWAEGRGERLADIAAELVRLKVDVIVTEATPPVAAAKQATSDIPIVGIGIGDPVRSGIVASLARPAGNVTALSLQNPDLAGKRVELLREVVPTLRRLAILADVGNPANVAASAEAQAAARMLGLEFVGMDIRRAEDIAPAFEGLRGSHRRFL